MPTILLVEDNELNRDMLSRRLVRRGYRVITAHDGEQGHAMACSSAPDLILMDVGLPGMDGWQVTRLLKSSGQTRAIPIIALTAHALPEGALKLELTESSIMSDSTSSVAMLSQVKALGVRLAIDDFGTGYSSLSYLHQFPLDTLKIDRSFTSAIRNGRKEESMIARTIMPLAEHLGLDVVAEGVETVEQATMLKELRCKYAQGFLFSKPLTADGVQKLLEKAPAPAGTDSALVP